MEHLAPGSWDYTRPPSHRELAATAVLDLDLGEASVKIRTGPPSDDVEDVSDAVWAGVVPLSSTFGIPERTPRCRPVPPRPHT